MSDGVSTSGSWPALGEMSQKAKREGERSPPEKAPGVPIPAGVEQFSSSVALSSMTASSSQEKSVVEKKGSGGESVSPGELLELEQQKLAGKRKGGWWWFGQSQDVTWPLFSEGANKQKWVPLNLDPPSRPPPSKGSHRGDRHYDRPLRDRMGERDHRDGMLHKDKDGYRDHYRGDRGYHHYYNNKFGGSGHDRDKERDGRDQDRGYRRGGERYNLPPRYANQPQGQEYSGVESGGSNYNSGFEGSNRYIGRGGGRPGRGGGRNWRYPMPATGHSEFSRK